MAGRSTWPQGILTLADEARFGGYEEALAFFGGEQWRETPRRGDPPQLVFNYARALIRKTASYVFPAPVGISVVPEDESPDVANRAERRLIALRDALDLTRLDLALTLDSAVLGDAAMKVTWDHEASQPRVVPVDPGTLVARWAPDNSRAVEAMTQGYALTGQEIGRLFPSSSESLDAGRRYPVIEEWTPARWRVLVAGQVVRDGPNPYGWIPYIVVANDPRPVSFWGTSDLDDLMDVCRELNRRMTVLSHVLELSGAPIAVLENVDGSEGIRVGPGAKWELPEGSRAYLLDLLQGGGAEIHLRYIDVLFRVLHDLSETPRTAFGDSGRNLSGAAL
ncbi:MAG TPA: phage portal protein, partial [Thermomicrobiales bacterium]|nr:phage portal protein [Thermomicrobiales bacterium]